MYGMVGSRCRTRLDFVAEKKTPLNFAIHGPFCSGPLKPAFSSAATHRAAALVAKTL